MVVRREGGVHERAGEGERLEAAAGLVVDGEGEAARGEGHGRERAVVRPPTTRAAPASHERRAVQSVSSVSVSRTVSTPAALTYARTCCSPGRQAGATSAAPSRRRSPVLSPATTRRFDSAQVRDPEPARRPAGVVDARPGERPPDLARRVERRRAGSGSRRRRAVRAATTTPRRSRRAAAWSRRRRRPRRRVGAVTRTRPSAGSEKSAGRACGTARRPSPSRSRHGRPRSRRGPAGSGRRRGSRSPTAAATNARACRLGHGVGSRSSNARAREPPRAALGSELVGRLDARAAHGGARARSQRVLVDLEPVRELVEAAAEAGVDGAARQVEHPRDLAAASTRAGA